MNSKYGQRGVSYSKSDVHQAIKDLDKGLFPNAFCKIMPDILGGDKDYCNIMHSDGAGTKSSLAYIYWKETGDKTVWQGIAQDAIVMNIDDLACVGAVENILLASTIGRNAILIPGEILVEIIKGTDLFIAEMRRQGVDIHLTGGETADVGDLVRTAIVDSTVTCRIKREDLIVTNIQDGDVIVGLASYGQASYEKEYNSGIGSNGLTSARHDVFSNYLASKYPESFDDLIPEKLVYTGKRRIKDPIPGLPINAGKLLLSPTRTYLPVVKKILQQCRKDIHGIIHCTGGGQTKVMNFVSGMHVVKDNLLPCPPVFRIIQENSETGWDEMYAVFNMGHRLEIYCNEKAADDIISTAKSFAIEAQIIGRCHKHTEKKLTIKSEFGVFEY